LAPRGTPAILPPVNRCETVRALIGRLHRAGGADFVEEATGSGVVHWRIRLGRWPFEVQIDRFALMVRCYTGDELFATGRIPEDEMEALLPSASGPGDPAALGDLQEYVDAEIRGDSRRFLTPPHAERHPDRRPESRHDAAIHAKPPREMDTPA